MPVSLFLGQFIIIVRACSGAHPAHAAGIKLHLFFACRQHKPEMDIALFIVGIRRISLAGHRQGIGNAVIGADDPVVVTAVIAGRIVLVKGTGSVLYGFDDKGLDIFIVII